MYPGTINCNVYLLNKRVKSLTRQVENMLEVKLYSKKHVTPNVWNYLRKTRRDIHQSVDGKKGKGFFLPLLLRP